MDGTCRRPVSENQRRGPVPEIEDVEVRLSELQGVLWSEGAFIPPSSYVKICDRLGDLVESISALRRSLS